MNKQQTGTIRKQVQLPLSVAFRISLLNIRVRFLRALITAAGIMLGIAFFTAVRAAALYAPPLDPNDPAALETATRQNWLVVMSLLMSTVGISNSMLMAVTERYKEIGTMKCLGALDSFVVKLFFLEAGILGVVASAIGFLVGWGLVFLINLFRLGASVWSAATPLELFGLLGQAMVIGVVLTVVATILPAIRAAKMPPAAALRVEV
ncbi:MAG: FtsX-like permease family protein [Armatimonadota bacterium]|jgi:putative ABC transport system permease protein|nr:FtsX-like permease family protein [Armatimonadota bacterium]